MKGEQDGWTERGTKGRQQNARRRWVDREGRRRENRISSINNTRCNYPATAPWPRAVNCKEADRRMMEDTRGGEEERTTEGQGDGWGNNRARGHRVRTTERWRRDACE